MTCWSLSFRERPSRQGPPLIQVPEANDETDPDCQQHSSIQWPDNGQVGVDPARGWEGRDSGQTVEGGVAIKSSGEGRWFSSNLESRGCPFSFLMESFPAVATVTVNCYGPRGQGSGHENEVGGLLEIVWTALLDLAGSCLSPISRGDQRQGGAGRPGCVGIVLGTITVRACVHRAAAFRPGLAPSYSVVENYVILNASAKAE